MSLIAELKRRNVIRMAGLYLVGAWLLVQVASTLFPAFGVPGWALRALVIVLALGIIPALAFAWVFELTPDGLKRDEELAPGQSIAPQTAQRMNRLIIAVLMLSLAYFALDKFVLAPKQAQSPVAEMAATQPPAATANADATTAAVDDSIAVLPFVDMSQDKDQEYFSDGLSEELLNQLAQIPQLRVIARTSSFAFKGKEANIADIARVLKVEHVLEGSVRKSGNSLRITAQLIRTSDSTHLWSQTYDRSLTDVFKVQDEISREVVSALKIKLLPGKKLDNTQRTRNPAAYEQYLIGHELSANGSRAAIQASLAAFERAVAIDPGYANAHARIGFGHAYLADFVDSPAQREAEIALAIASAEKAIALAPDMAIGYLSRGDTRYRMRWDWQGAQADLAQALALEPNSTQVMFGSVQMLFTLGRREQGLEVMRRVTSLTPLSSAAWTAFGRYLEVVGENAEAKQAFARALEIEPQQNWANFLLGNLLLAEGHTDEAISHYRRAPAEFQATGLAMAEFTRGNEAASQQLLAKLEKESAIGFAFQIAQVHAWRGEKDQAFAWLDRAYAIRDAGLARLPFDRAMDPLRDDPRFAALMRKMGLPE